MLVGVGQVGSRARELRLDIEQALSRNQQLRSTGHRADRPCRQFRRRSAGRLDHLDWIEARARQCPEQVGVCPPEGSRRRRARQNRCGHRAGRLDVILVTQRAGRPRECPDVVPFGFGARVVCVGGPRPLGEHDRDRPVGGTGCQPLPQLFGHKRSVGMQQAQRFFEHPRQQRAIRLAGARQELERFQVPVGDLVPEEVVNHTPGFAKVELAQQARDFGGHRRETTGNPPLHQCSIGGWHGRLERAAALLGGGAGHHEAPDVPQLVHEIASRIQDGRRECEVVTGRNTDRDSKS